ncbi:LysR substrate-binding domain-containing protein [Collinsella sp. An2]|uniref:LysR family transcriptional regulator n=1 Tax=Collinsella sp. An2 TaxID=1965585 RepID=UPI000B39C8AC|nr:LysR substrate-binding domain-containing protein [Collinsella sp. An2]OUP10498.1 hypothetical protein B5F33_02720 [Collinsella sp. An2]
MLDPRMHTFLEVYRQGGFTKAAEALHLSQPAVSQHIRILERTLGAQLFVKRGRSTVPTAAGDVLYRQVSRLENDASRIADEVRRAAAADGETALRFGATRTVADYVMPSILSRQLQEQPAAHLAMTVGNTHELIDQLEQGDIDFAIVEGPYDRTHFDGAALSHEPYVAVAAAESIGTPASVTDLLGQRLIVREEGSGTREILERALAVRDLGLGDFTDVVELGSITTIKACVAAGQGISFLYRTAVRTELDAGGLVDVTPPDFSIVHDFTLIWQRDSIYGERYRHQVDIWKAWIPPTDDRP